MKSILKRGKKKEGDFPKKFNGFLEFNHKGAVSNSRSEEKSLVGCEDSDTLYIESDFKESPISLILSGEYGKGILQGFQDRFESSPLQSLYLGFTSDSSDFSGKSNIELPEEKKNIKSFLQGNKWFQLNESRIKSYLDKNINNKSLAFVFLDNNPFILGVMEKVIEYIKGTQVQPILFVHLPTENRISEEFSILAFIYSVLKKEAIVDVPVILTDEKYAAKLNSGIEIEDLTKRILLRESNIIADIILGTSMKSEFYQTDFSNFVRIFSDTKGICQLFSFEIYDNNPDLSVLFNSSKKAMSYQTKESPTRGYAIIQPGPEGLKTDSYQNIREYYGNSDVILSILKRKTSGAIVRGIFCYITTPKILTNRYSKLDKFSVVLYDSDGQVLSIDQEKLFDEIFNAENYEIEMIEDTRKQSVKIAEKNAEDEP